MAKVCKLNIRVNGRDLQGQVFYTPSLKRFHFKFPQEIEDWGAVARGDDDDKPLATGKSQEELEKEIQEVIKRYEKSAMKERKVIAYSIVGKSTREELRKDLEEEADEDAKESIRIRASRHDESVEIELKMAILLERTVGSNKLFLKQELDHNGKPEWAACSQWGYSDWHIIPWTPAAEKFFNDFYGGCEELIRRMDKYVGTPERAKKAITNSARLLGGPDGK